MPKAEAAHYGTEKKELLHKLQVLLDVAGTKLPWEQIKLERLTESALRALEYRVRQSRADSYDEGAYTGSMRQVIKGRK